MTTDQSETIRWSSRNSRIDGNSSETGTTVSVGTNVAINAGGDITARAVALSAGKDLSPDAGGKLLLYAGQAQTHAQTKYSQRSGMSYNDLNIRLSLWIRALTSCHSRREPRQHHRRAERRDLRRSAVRSSDLLSSNDR